ncbi:MAG: cytochrome c [Myxococcota bacterium]|nr:cytochrome c [Myxococcota bacterium]
MPTRRMRVLLGLVLASLLGSGCHGQTSSEPPIHFIQNMDQQDRYDAQEPNSFFPDGRAARGYVEGTVAAHRVGGKEFDCLFDWEDEHRCTGKVDGAWSVALPMEVDAELLQRGRARYDIYCTPCHDAAGNGQGTVVQRNAGMVPPPSYHDDRLRQMPMGQFFDIISNGVRNMPPYAKQIPVDDRWAIAAYIRVLQRSQNVSLSDVDSTVRKARGWEE